MSAAAPKRSTTRSELKAQCLNGRADRSQLEGERERPVDELAAATRLSQPHGRDVERMLPYAASTLGALSERIAACVSYEG